MRYPTVHRHEGGVMPPRPRTLIHPGSYNPVRIQSCSAPQARHIRLLLRPGATLYEALVGPLARAGIAQASMTLLGGAFARLDYCTAPPDPTHRAVVAYTEPIQAGAAELVFGNATLGKTDGGLPLVHCHAVFRDAGGRLAGGHIVPQTSVIGAGAPAVLATSLEGFELRASYDEETHIRLLQPFKDEHHERR